MVIPGHAGNWMMEWDKGGKGQIKELFRFHPSHERREPHGLDLLLMLI